MPLAFSVFGHGVIGIWGRLIGLASACCKAGTMCWTNAECRRARARRNANPSGATSG